MQSQHDPFTPEAVDFTFQDSAFVCRDEYYKFYLGLWYALMNAMFNYFFQQKLRLFCDLPPNY